MADQTGRPATSGSFRPGPDPRRADNRGKRLGKFRIDVMLTRIGAESLPEALRDKAPEAIRNSKTMFEALMRSVYLHAIRGESWAVEFIANRTEGKVTDKLAVEGGQTLTVVEEIVDGGNTRLIPEASVA